jgi:hypothetical protein
LNPSISAIYVPRQFSASCLRARPSAWQLLDRAIGATMFVLAALLLRHALGGGWSRQGRVPAAALCAPRALAHSPPS